MTATSPPPITKWPTLRQIDAFEATGRISARRAEALRVMAAKQETDQQTPGVGDVRPLPGHDIPWREWVPKEYLRRDCAPFGPFHVRLWDWFDGLELDVKSPSAVVPWARGLGKSTSLEGGIIRTCVKGTRRFWLYVSRTLDDANNHVMAIARVLERMGIERQVNKYGLAVGWNAQRLRTASGFSILSFGLDAGARGIKLDDVRPDGIALDDIDHLGDSMDMIEKKCRIITNTIMQAGSPSFATIFVQNPIGPHTVMSRVLDGRLPIMADRDEELSKIIPAVYDLEYEIYYSEDGRELARITGGTSSWEGKTLEDWQYQIDKGTLDGFLIECQHDIYIGTSFFDRYAPEKHDCVAQYTPLGLDGPNVPTWCVSFGGFDWGYDDDDPSAFCLNISDERGCVHCLISWHAFRQSNDELAAKICATLAEWGISKSDCEIYADGSMWAQKTFNGVKAEADVEAFYRAGLRMVRGAQGPVPNRHRNNMIRAYLAWENMLKIYRGYNTVLTDSLKNASPQKIDRNQILHNIYSHIAVALGHSLSSRPEPSNMPQRDLTTEERQVQVKEEYDATNKQLAENALIDRNKAMGLVPQRGEDNEILRDASGNIKWAAAKKR